MKSTVTTLALAVAAIVVPGASRSATAQAIMTPYRGVETLVKDVDPGRLWVSDGILHIRNGRQILFDDADDPRMTGEVTITFNVNFHLAPPPVFGHGPMWGTVRIENVGGSWVGAWVGKKTTQGHSFIRTAMKGEGGYEGLYARAEYVRRTPAPTMPLEFAGTILQTPSR
jgi:hypothetical protein